MSLSTPKYREIKISFVQSMDGHLSLGDFRQKCQNVLDCISPEEIVKDDNLCYLDPKLYEFLIPTDHTDHDSTSCYHPFQGLLIRAENNRCGICKLFYNKVIPCDECFIFHCSGCGSDVGDRELCMRFEYQPKSPLEL